MPQLHLPPGAAYADPQRRREARGPDRLAARQARGDRLNLVRELPRWHQHPGMPSRKVTSTQDSRPHPPHPPPV